jgi:hypothetical protein
MRVRPKSWPEFKAELIALYYAGMEVAQGCTDPKGLKSRTECRFV